MPDADLGTGGYADRYAALPRHPQRIVCEGMCEGTGVIPVYMVEGDHRTGDGLVRVAEEDDETLRALWRQAEEEAPAGDGWHFVRCPDCDGTGIEGAPSDEHHYTGWRYQS